MIILPLTTEDSIRLKRLQQDQVTLTALKKLFINQCINTNINSDVQTLAAERVAVEIIKQAFYNLSMIEINIETGTSKDNLV